MEILPVIFKSKSMELQLEHHMLPAPPLTYANKTEIKKVYYPGNSEPTVQVLNATHENIELTGEFKDWVVKRDGFAQYMVNQFMAMKALAEEVTMEYGPHIFIGMIEEFTPSIRSIHEIGYKLIFNVFYTDQDPKVKTLPEARAQIDMTQIYTYESNLETALEGIKNVPSNIKNLETEISNILSKIDSELSNDNMDHASALSLTGLDYVRGIVKELPNISKTDFTDLCNVHEVFHILSGMRRELMNIVEYTPEKETIVHIVKDGETIYKIAGRYDMDWQVLATTNNLSSLALSMGQKLVIPV